MSYTDEAKAKVAALGVELEEEENTTILSKVRIPSMVEKVLSFQFENLDTLPITDLEKYLGTLSQYHIYINKYVNELYSKVKVSKSVYNRKLNQAVIAISASARATIKEREMQAINNNPELVELEDYVNTLDAKHTVYSNIPDTIGNLIQTIKKVYDARIRERERGTM